MVDLVLRPSGLPLKGWALQLRLAGPAETDYYTLCYVKDEHARLIVEAGGAFYLFGEPKSE